MRLHTLIVAYTLADELTAMIDSIVSRHHTFHHHLFLHSRLQPVVSACEQIAKRPDTTYYPFGVNRGLSKSWNQGMIRAFNQGADALLLINDDCILDTGDVDRLAEVAYIERDSLYMVEAVGYDKRQQKRKLLGFSCCILNRIAFERVGCFDENFFPAYYEDIDFKHRADLQGLQVRSCDDTQVLHLGSASIAAHESAAKLFESTFAANQAYYRRKWGGDTALEQFNVPFNDPSLSNYIAPANRNTPYGALYDRTDW